MLGVIHIGEKVDVDGELAKENDPCKQLQCCKRHVCCGCFQTHFWNKPCKFPDCASADVKADTIEGSSSRSSAQALGPTSQQVACIGVRSLPHTISIVWRLIHRQAFATKSTDVTQADHSSVPAAMHHGSDCVGCGLPHTEFHIYQDRSGRVFDKASVRGGSFRMPFCDKVSQGPNGRRKEERRWVMPKSVLMFNFDKGGVATKTRATGRIGSPTPTTIFRTIRVYLVNFCLSATAPGVVPKLKVLPS